MELLRHWDTVLPTKCMHNFVHFRILNKIVFCLKIQQTCLVSDIKTIYVWNLEFVTSKHNEHQLNTSLSDEIYLAMITFTQGHKSSTKYQTKQRIILSNLSFHMKNLHRVAMEVADSSLFTVSRHVCVYVHVFVSVMYLVFGVNCVHFSWIVPLTYSG